MGVTEGRWRAGGGPRRPGEVRPGPEPLRGGRPNIPARAVTPRARLDEKPLPRSLQGRGLRRGSWETSSCPAKVLT